MSTKTVTLHDATAHFAELVARAAEGEDFLIEDSGETLAHLGPPTPSSEDRVFGQYRGEIRISEDFDEALPVDQMLSLEGLT